MENKVPNRLINEKSLYLRQHAHNPVDWYPWGEEAFARAAAEDKPVFISIGYSSCHWCHVMALECFENQKIADYLNEFFVSIKVDREERPDIDHVYMSSCQAVTGSGGWPLSVFAGHDKKPFYAGTYFPPPVFLQLLKNIVRLWQKNRSKLLANGELILAHIKSPVFNPEAISYTAVEEGYLRLKQSFDPEYGGFFSEPKFPLPHYVWFLLKYYQCYYKEETRIMVEKTLDALREGGICDHVGGGFFRYSTDRHWTIPHFEKMLYDNVMLLYVYAEAYRALGIEKYRSTADKIAGYLLTRLRSKEGGFYAAEDADSEGEEGKYYLFTYDEIAAALGARADIFTKYFDVTPRGNFHSKNVLRLKEEISPADAEVIGECLQLLRGMRAERTAPLLDNKVLTAGNGLAIAAFAFAGRVFENVGFIKAAEETFRFIEDKLMVSGRLHARYCEGETKYPATAADYTALLFGLIELYEATFKEEFLNKAQLLNVSFFGEFYDIIDGGYYYTGRDSETVLFRFKEYTDGAVPSSNALQVYNLYRLSALTNAATLYETAEQTLRLLSGEIRKHPLDCLFSLQSVLMRYHGALELNVVVPPGYDRGSINDAIDAIDWPFINVWVMEGERLEIRACAKGKCYPPIAEFAQLSELIKRT